VGDEPLVILDFFGVLRYLSMFTNPPSEAKGSVSPGKILPLTKAKLAYFLFLELESQIRTWSRTPS